jgi:N-acetylneuraminic acid mutarotase
LVAFGTTGLNEHNLKSYARELAIIGSALAPGGELDLWSCDVAAGERGASFVRDLAVATDAGVAAADHAVGSSALGGDWKLDVTERGARAHVPFSVEAMKASTSILGTWSGAASMATARALQTATLLGNGKVLVAGGVNWDTGAAIASVELYDPVSNTWSAAAAMAVARLNATATLLSNGKVLVTGGQNSSGHLSSAELYDPISDSWSSAGSMAAARSNQTATLLDNGTVLITGGLNSTGSLSSAELYDPVSNTWSAAAAMSTPRYVHTATRLGNGEVLITGGTVGNAVLSSAELYDPVRNTWSAAGSMAMPRYYHTATLLANGQVLVVGGTDGGNDWAGAELYDPTSNTWSAAGSLATARIAHTATLLGDGTVLIAGGANGNGALSSAESYDPVRNQWSSAGSLGAARNIDSATLLPSGLVLVVGGVGASDHSLASAELYDPSFAHPPGAWNPTGSLLGARDSASMALLPNGKVLLAGGVDNTTGAASATAEIYDPASGTWTAAASMAWPREGQPLTTLGNGEVLIAGGAGLGGLPIANAELYDPVQNTWSVAPPMSTARDRPTATLLGNGKVLYAGGLDHFDHVLSSAELYDPATNRWSDAGSMSTPRYQQSATLLSDGRVLVAGGVDGSNVLASAEIYDPVSNTWSAAASMALPRESPTATLLGNGKVLIVGAPSALYDPVTDTWSAAGSMINLRDPTTSIRLNDGDVLVSGDNGFLTGAELYDPLTNAFSVAGPLSTYRIDQRMILLGSGKALVAGGFNSAEADLYDPAGPDPLRSTLSVTTTRIGLGTIGFAASGTVTLTARDAAGNQESQGGMSVSFGLGAGTGSVTFFTLQDLHDGTYIANFLGTVPGPITITATLNNQVITSALPTITVLPPTHFQISAPATATPGAPASFTVVSLDEDNQPSDYNGTVHFSSTDGAAFLPADVALVHGGGVFSATFNSVGTQVITVNATALPGISGTSSLIAVSPLATRFVVSAPATVTVGTPFLMTVTAMDDSGREATGYSGTLEFTSTDTKAVLPPPHAAVINGVGTFLVTLKTVAGSPWTITATDLVTSSINGTSGPIAVSPGAVSFFNVLAPTAATTGTPIPITVTAMDAYGNVATGYAGHVHFSSTDGGASLPGDAILTSGTGIFNVTLNTAGRQNITVADAVATSPTVTCTSNPVTTRGLVVGSFTPAADGFTVTFSKAFDPSKLTLYGSGLSTIQDVTLVGAHSGPITGTVYVDPSNKSITFKATTSYLQSFFSRPVLPDDTYTATLVSGTNNGFGDGSAGLDGADDGGQANYTVTFTTANQAKLILSIPDFARGPDGSHNIKVPSDTSNGIPVILFNASNVTDVFFSVSYNSTLLNVTAASTLDTSAAGSTFTLIPNVPPASVATFKFHNDVPQSGTVVLGDILADVPDSAAAHYKAKEILTLSGITVNSSPFTGVTADGVHVNAYFGDVTGNGSIDALDVATANNVAQGLSTGFGAYTLLDPAIIGDVAGDISVDAGDVSTLAAYVSQLPTPKIPAIPTGLAITPTGPDPTLWLGGEERGMRGEPNGNILASLPSSLAPMSVLLDDPRPAGSTGMTEAVLALTYDPALLSVSAADIALGSIASLGTGWKIQTFIDQNVGRIAVLLYSTTPIAAAGAGSLVTIAFHTRDEPAGAHPQIAAEASVRLVSSVVVDGVQFTTQVDDSQGAFVLSPAAQRRRFRPPSTSTQGAAVRHDNR